MKARPVFMIICIITSVLAAPPTRAAGPTQDEAFLKQQARERVLRPARESVHRGRSDLSERQIRELAEWQRRSRDLYQKYYRTLLQKGPDAPDTQAAKQVADKKSQEFWSVKGAQHARERKELGKEEARTRTRVVDRLNAQGLAPAVHEAASAPVGHGLAKPGPAKPDAGNPASPEETVLDGSDIPKEISFPSRGKPTKPHEIIQPTAPEMR